MKSKKFNFFISYATEDRETASALMKLLQKQGFTVWIDHQQLTLGDSLRGNVERGLIHSDMGIVLLSRRFFAKKWTTNELGGLYSRYFSKRRNIILPVRHGVDSKYLRRVAPMLSDLVSVSTEPDLKIVVKEIKRAFYAAFPNAAIAAAQSVTGTAPVPAARAGYLDPRNHQVLKKYAKAIRARHGLVSFIGLPTNDEDAARDVPLTELFVPPKMSESRLLPESLEELNDLPTTEVITQALQSYSRLVLLGDPGSGKTTVVNWIASSLCSIAQGQLERDLGVPYVPLVFVLRELKLRESPSWDDLIASFIDAKGASFQGPGAMFAKEKKLLKSLLESGQAFIIFDGYDELGEQTRRTAIREAIWDGMIRYPQCRWLFTSRVVGYDEAILHEWEIRKSLINPDDQRRVDRAAKASFEVRTIDDATGEPDTDESKLVKIVYSTLAYLAPLDDGQQKEFSHLWWKHHSGNHQSAETLSEEFIHALRTSVGPRTLGRNPTLLTLCCFFYRSEGSLPDGRYRLYELICEAYLSTINKVRRIAMAMNQRVFQYPMEEQMDWLSEVAFYLQTRDEDSPRDRDKCLLTKDEWLEKLAYAIKPRTGDTAAKVAIDFFEYLHKRSGLISEIGVKAKEKLHAFVHPSFQEFFAGRYLIRVWTDPDWWTAKAGDPGTETETVDASLLPGSRPWFERAAGKSRSREMFVFAWEGAGKVNSKYPRRILERLLKDDEKTAEWPEFATDRRGWQPEAVTSFVEVIAALANNSFVTFDGTVKFEGPVREALLIKCWRFQFRAYRIIETGRYHPGDYIGVAKLLLARPDREEIAIKLIERQLERPEALELDHLNFSFCAGLRRLPNLSKNSKVKRIIVYKCPRLSEKALREFKANHPDCEIVNR